MRIIKVAAIITTLYHDPDGTTRVPPTFGGWLMDKNTYHGFVPNKAFEVGDKFPGFHPLSAYTASANNEEYNRPDETYVIVEPDCELHPDKMRKRLERIPWYRTQYLQEQVTSGEDNGVATER